MSLYDQNGRRKYLTPRERTAFLRAARAVGGPVGTLCQTLAHSGCRISEALALTAGHVDVLGGVLVIECLKKRRKGVYRAVPVPPAFLHGLKRVHGFSRASETTEPLLWPWSRVTAWRRVREVMAAAGITGPHATPKGLRHGFGIHAVSCGVPLNLVQRWLGHAQLSTTAIYANAMGPEEMQIARRMWRRPAA